MSTTDVFQTERHAYVERQMEGLGIRWTVETISVNDLRTSDNTFQTRANVATYDKGTANEYAESIKAGDAFPMIVVQQVSDGTYRLVCGRTRAAAYKKARNGVDKVAVYVVEHGTDHCLLLALSARENNGNGVRQSKSENAQTAVDYLKNVPLACGCSSHTREEVKRVAKVFGVAPQTLQERYQAELAVGKLIEMDLPYQGTSRKALTQLYYYFDRKGFEELLRIVVNTKHAEVGDILRAARKEEATVAEVIKRIEALCSNKDALPIFQGRKTDRLQLVLEHLSLAHNELAGIGQPSNFIAEQISEVSDLLALLAVDFKAWRNS